ncbi:MAG: PAS domain S-box protein [Alphaproteobacteria bacterium]|nr:PAS domain S-box protein [Alphaproteobacteria bacterium]
MSAAEALSKSGSWAWSPAANEITHWSKGRYRLFGFDPAAGVPSLDAVLERIHPEDRALWLESKTRVTLGGETDFDFRIVLPDGETKHVHAVGRPILSQSGAVVEIIGAAVDVTEQKQAQEALRESEEQWKAVFENNPTMYFMLDSSHIILSVNPFGAEQLGYAREDLIGRHVGTVIHEDDREYALKKQTACLERLGRSASWETRKVRKDGSVIHARETGRAVLIKARPVVLIASEDITEAKRAAEALRETQAQVQRLVDANIIGIETWHFDGRVLAANDAYLKILGYSREDLVSGLLRWPDLTPPEWRDISFARFDEVKSTGIARPHQKEWLYLRYMLIHGRIG